MHEASPIPPPRPDDDEDVNWALSTAGALWARGDTAEALKWLRRAAETASDQNRDQRSLELFKAAADATSLLSASQPPTAQAHASHPPPIRSSGTPPPPQVQGSSPPARGSATPPPPSLRPAQTPPPPRVTSGASAPGAATPGPPVVGGRPAGSVAAARSVLHRTLPSEGLTGARDAALGGGGQGNRVPQARPTPAGVPPTAAKRNDRKTTLDGRFQFPDEEVTVERDLAALRRPRPVAPPADEDAVSAMASTSPLPTAVVRSTGAPARPRDSISSPAPRDSAGAAAAARTATSVASAAARSAVATARGAASRPAHADDLDEQTSVLSGDEAELEFAGSETGESSTLPPTDGDKQGEAHPITDPTSDEHPSSASDEPLYAPSIRPQPVELTPRQQPSSLAALASNVAGGTAARHTPAVAAPNKAAWPALRVALRRDAGGLRIEPLALDAAVPPGAVAALLVAPDTISAQALARLLDPR